MFDFLDFNLLDVLDIILVAPPPLLCVSLGSWHSSNKYFCWNCYSLSHLENHRCAKYGTTQQYFGWVYERWSVCLNCCVSTRNQKTPFNAWFIKLSKPEKNSIDILKLFSANQSTQEPELNIEALVQSCSSLKKTKNRVRYWFWSETVVWIF